MDRSGIEERVELSLLYDFYGALLKENQQRMYEMSILEDYGYSEIAEEEGISRQAVYDSIKRATKQLREYEEKLGLVARFVKQKDRMKMLHKQLVSMEHSENEQWRQIFALLEEIIAEL